uniref:INPP5B PH domain-containing protein n=1 Tax=Maylandia zebra TaxID=106582 RepID=A0A3P9BH15_9CICH
MDQSVAIQETLEREENCIMAVQCDVLFDDTTESRLLGLVESANEHAIFIYTHRRMAITADDVLLEAIIPISVDFAVVTVSSPEELVVVGADTRVRISYKDEELDLKLPFGSNSRLFLSEVNKAWSDVCRTPTQIPKFDWITKYQKDTRGQEVVKQALAPIGTTLTKLNQHGKTGFSPYFNLYVPSANVSLCNKMNCTRIGPPASVQWMLGRVLHFVSSCVQFLRVSIAP